MKIGVLSCDLSHKHGWAHYSLSLLQALQRAGADLRIITSRNSPDQPGLPATRILPNLTPAEGLILPKLAAQLPVIRRAFQDCDVIHATVEPFAPAAAWVRGQRPAVVTAHGSYVQLLPQRRFPVGALYARSLSQSRLVCVSRYTESVARAALPNAETVVINNGVDAERFAQLPPLSQPKTGPVVLCVGAVKARKGILELVQAMAPVRDAFPTVQCVIIGSLNNSAYVAQVQQAITTLGLTQHVQLLGHVPDETLLAWYGAADVFALPSLNIKGKFEGYGIAHLEASAAGLPVIGTRDCGAADAIHDGETGILLSQADLAGTLPQAISHLLSHPDEARRMGAAGKAHAQRQSWDAVAQQMIALYHHV
jgi:glycosyltransferase involved in cell wall biosynthesis